MEQDELKHYGVLGMKWGVRRYTNADGSLNDAGKERVNKWKAKEIGKVESRKKDLDNMNSYLDKRREKIKPMVDEHNRDPLNQPADKEKKLYGKLDNLARDQIYIDANSRIANAEIKKISKMTVKEIDNEINAVRKQKGKQFLDGVLLAFGGAFRVGNKSTAKIKTDLRVSKEKQQKIIEDENVKRFKQYRGDKTIKL